MPSLATTSSRLPLPMALLMLMLLLLIVPSDAQKTPRRKVSAAKSTQFSVDLYRAVGGTAMRGNVAMCPMGLEPLLGSLQLGARGNTRREMEKVIGTSAKGLRATRLPSSLRSPLLTRALALFIHGGGAAQEVSAGRGSGAVRTGGAGQPGGAGRGGGAGSRSGLRTFAHRSAAAFGTETRPLRSDGGEAAARQVNAWVLNHTHGAVKDFLSPDQLPPGLTRLVLVSAVVLRGVWLSPFDPAHTNPRPFTSPGRPVKIVPAMQRTGVYRYGEFELPGGNFYEVLEIPYADGRTAMWVALPPPDKDGSALAALEDSLTGRTIVEWEGQSRSTRLTLQLPRFTVESKLELKPALQSLGLREMFDERRANFKGITAREQLYVSTVLQQTRVEVDEKGTRAVSATGVVALLRSFIPTFACDRPFLFIITHKHTDSILFMGRVTDP